MSKLIDLTGKEFGQLKVLKQSKEKPDKSGFIKWMCQCSCRKITHVDGGRLRAKSIDACPKCMKLKQKGKL
jgi:hypothetical protein